MNTVKRKQIFNFRGISSAHVHVCVFSVSGLDSQGTSFYVQFQTYKCKTGGLKPDLTCGYHKAQHKKTPGLETSMCYQHA